MTVGERIRNRREALGISQVSLADSIGEKKQTIYKYENNIVTNIPIDKISLIASALSATPSYIMGWEEPDSPSPRGVQIPVLGTVVAGIPIEAVEEILGYEEITPQMAAQGEYFALRIRGSSMEPRMVEGDVVIVRQQSDVDSGDIAVVLVNGNEATVKKVRKQESGLSLIPSNPNYDVMFFTPQEVESLPVRIIGKVVELRAKM